MIQTNRHIYFRARNPVGICAPSSRSVTSCARPSTSYIAFNASQSDNSRACSYSTCCREYSSMYGCNTGNLKNKIGPFTNRCNSKQTRTFPMKRMPYYCNCSALSIMYQTLDHLVGTGSFNSSTRLDAVESHPSSLVGQHEGRPPHANPPPPPPLGSLYLGSDGQ